MTTTLCVCWKKKGRQKDVLPWLKPGHRSSFCLGTQKKLEKKNENQESKFLPALEQGLAGWGVGGEGKDLKWI